MQKFHPSVPEDSWTPVIANANRAQLKALGMNPDGDTKQILAAWKKWFGIAHMMDLGDDAPAYGLMLDSEVLMYSDADCGANSAWYKLFHRIQQMEASGTFPVSQVSTNHSFMGEEHGCGYDRGIIKRNADWLTPGGLNCLRKCTERGCKEVAEQIDLCRFSWWTDIPYVNLAFASRMFAHLSSRQWQKRMGGIYGYTPLDSDGCDVRGPNRYKRLMQRIRFPMFEYICYQQWCVLNEGFSFRDVTSISGLAKWGSYLEDPLPGSRLADLHPIWVSAETVVSSERGRIKRLAEDKPPLIIFHVDHDGHRFNVEHYVKLWKPVVGNRK